MSILITIIVYFTNLINSLFKKHSKIIVMLFIILLWILMGANTQNPDINVYKMGYENISYGSFEPGYILLERIFIFLNFEYEAFRMFLSLVGILLIHNTVKSLIKNQSAFYLLYAVYPFMLDVVQMRNFISMAILIYAIPYLLSENQIGPLKYVVLVLIAGSIQIIAIVYLPLVVFVRMRKTGLKKIVYGVCILFLLAISLNENGRNMISQLLIITMGSYNEKVKLVVNKQTQYGYLLFWLIQCINFMLIYWTNKNYNTNENSKFLCRKKRLYINIDLREKRCIEHKYIVLMFWVNVYAFSFMPLYVFWSTFSRCMRNIVPLNILAYIIAGNSLPSKSFRKTIFTATYILYIFILFFIEIYILYGESIMKAIFKYNSFF